MTLTCLAQLSQWAPCYSYIGTLGLFVCTWFPFSSLCGKRKDWFFFQDEDKTFYILQFPSKKYPLPTGQFCEVFNLCGDFANIFKYVGLCEDTILRYLREDDMTSLLTIQAITTKPISENI